MKNIFSISWTSEYTEFRVEIDSGSGYIIVADNYTTSKTWSYTTDVISITVKVTPYIDSILTPSAALITTYSTPAKPANLSIDGDINDTVILSWDAVSGATEYVISLQYITEKISRSTTELTTTFTIDNLESAGGAWPEFWIYVYAKSDFITSLPSKIIAQAPIPDQISDAIVQERFSAGIMLSWSEISGATGYKIYKGSTVDFDPATEGTLVYDDVYNITTINGLDFSTDYQYFFKVAAYNHYNKDRTVLNFSDTIIVIATAGNEIFCKTFDDADISGISKITRFQNSFGDYFYIKTYPTISASINGTIDDIGSSLISINDANISGIPKLIEFTSNGINYYIKACSIISVEVEDSAGVTLNPVYFLDSDLSGIPRVARVNIDSSYRYFKIYPVKG